MAIRLWVALVAIGVCIGLANSHAADDEDPSATEDASQSNNTPPLKKIFLPKSPVAAAYLLRRLTNSELVQIERSEPVYVALLTRAGLSMKYRQEAIAGLVKLRQTEPLTELLGGIEQLAGGSAEESESPLRDLAQLLSTFDRKALAEHRDALQALATSAELSLVRRIGYMGLVVADGEADRAWSLAQQTPGGLPDMIAAVPLISDLDARARLYPRITGVIENSTDQEALPAAIVAMVSIPQYHAESFKRLSALLRQQTQPFATIDALLQIPKSKWDKDAVKPMLDALLALASSVPTSQRTEGPFLNAMQLGNDLASLLPKDEANRVRGELNKLGVPIIVLRAVPHKMIYDKSAVAVEVGKPIELVFENTDIMPHNLVIVKPGAVEEVGTLAEKMQTEPDAIERQFIPDSDQILFHTNMLQPADKVRLSIVAPATPGTYHYLCTYPGHWRRMNGILHVVDNLERFLAENELPDAEEIAEQRPFVREWTFEDLEGELSGLTSGRSFEQGQAMFKAGSCSTCHKVEEAVGGEVGPSLKDVAKRLKPHEVLTEVLDPSQRIHEKFQSYSIETVQGKLITGLLVSQDDNEVRVLVNPLASCEAVVIARDEIDFMQAAKISAMPKGLLNTLNKEEILDLLAYLLANGDPRNPAFQ